jgi:predicted enzyme related to lactoylglutathione lyase
MSMAQFTDPTSGTFCWADLQTTDPAAARAFYGKVLDWQFTDMPGPMPYAVASVPSGMTAGVMELPARAKAAGAPPHWMPYIAVDDVEATVARVAELGGKVMAPTMKMDAGAFAVLADPADGVFAVWRPTRSMGTTVYGESGGVGWDELASTDVKAARAFYTALFGWTFEVVPMLNIEYTILKKDGVGIAGLMAMPAGAPGGRSSWTVYFVVDDADAAFATATDNGAQVVLPLMDVATVGRFGFLTDPLGAVFAVIEMELPAA